jgi:hypothetical protein
MALVQSVIRRSWVLCSTWKNLSREHGWGEVNSFIEGRESPVLPDGKREEEEGGMVGTGAVCQQRESFPFSGAFKIYTTPWEGRPEVPTQ